MVLSLQINSKETMTFESSKEFIDYVNTTMTMAGIIRVWDNEISVSDPVAAILEANGLGLDSIDESEQHLLTAECIVNQRFLQYLLMTGMDVCLHSKYSGSMLIAGTQSHTHSAITALSKSCLGAMAVVSRTQSQPTPLILDEAHHFGRINLRPFDYMPEPIEWRDRNDTTTTDTFVLGGVSVTKVKNNKPFYRVGRNGKQKRY